MNQQTIAVPVTWLETLDKLCDETEASDNLQIAKLIAFASSVKFILKYNDKTL